MTIEKIRVYNEAQNEWIAKHQIKVGDLVRINRVPEPYENGWDRKRVNVKLGYGIILQVWQDGDGFSIGYIGTDLSKIGYSKSTSLRSFYCPYFVLEPFPKEEVCSIMANDEYSYLITPKAMFFVGMYASKIKTSVLEKALKQKGCFVTPHFAAGWPLYIYGLDREIFEVGCQRFKIETWKEALRIHREMKKQAKEAKKNA